MPETLRLSGTENCFMYKKCQETGRKLYFMPRALRNFKKKCRDHGRTAVPGAVPQEAERREENR